MPGIAIPFYLAHPRLMRLERSQMLEVEGGTPEWCLQILRHEAGHAFDNAYALRRRRRRVRLFGSPSTPYPDFYLPRPYSKSFVLHLDSWYGQSHPDEDFAETFAVWLTPDSDWRSRYAGWSALRKLEYMDELDARGRRAAAGRTHAPQASSRSNGLRTTLRKHYAKKRAHYGVDYPNFHDRDLRRLFSDAPEYRKNPLASRVMHQLRRDVRRDVAEWTERVPIHHRSRDRRHDRPGARTPPAPETPARPHEARLHDPGDSSDDELPALGETPGGALTRVRSQRSEVRSFRVGCRYVQPSRHRLLVASCRWSSRPRAQSGPNWIDAYRPAATRLIAESQRTDFAWQRLAEVTDLFGPRLSGSDALERAIDWAVATMKKDGLENVHKEPVMIPKWVRGRESLELVEPVRQPLPMLGLGNSVGTPASGLEGDVLVVSSFDDLKAHAADVKGRIVLFNVLFTNYGETVVYRATGPVEASKLGAIAVLVRSVGPAGLRTPHTGATNYADGVTKIPAAAIPTEDADRFARLQARGVKVRVKLSMEGALRS